MNRWRFYQGLRNEWRWYELGENGRVLRASDHAFDELAGCMQNASAHGFDGHTCHVHMRGAAQPRFAESARVMVS
jgi:hypothetical protein